MITFTPPEGGLLSSSVYITVYLNVVEVVPDVGVTVPEVKVGA
jgi:hypothetical protein